MTINLSKITTKGVTTSYALIDFGNGVRCAWCEKLVSEIGEDKLDAHLTEHERE